MFLLYIPIKNNWSGKIFINNNYWFLSLFLHYEVLEEEDLILFQLFITIKEKSCSLSIATESVQGCFCPNMRTKI